MKLFNTASGQKEDFAPDSKKLGLYICGPTVYSDTHLGHAKSYVSFDILKRWLGYKGYEVNHIQNFTDVSDETALGAAKSSVDELEFSLQYEKEFLGKMKLLANTSATKYTRASDFVEQIAAEFISLSACLTAALVLFTGIHFILSSKYSSIKSLHCLNAMSFE